MMSVRLTVTESRQAAWERAAESPLFAQWSGMIDWPTVPRPGVDHWVHCGEWSAEEINHTYFYGPPLPRGSSPITFSPGVTVEIITTAEVIAHLIADHGFTGEPS